jgi:hypothetical protein
MSMPSDDLRRWRERRNRRLTALPWLRAEQPTGGPAVWYVADELLVAADHRDAARQALTARGHRARDVVEDDGGPGGFHRYRTAGLDVPAAVRAVRRAAERAGDTRPVAGPNHVFGSAPFEHGGPFGPPRPIAAPTGWLAPVPTPVPTPVAVVDTGVWRDSPLPSDVYDVDDADVEIDVDVDDDGIIDGDVGHANFIAGVVLRRTSRARVRVIRALDTFGLCTEADLVAALARVREPLINLSLGGFTLDNKPPPVLTHALDGLLADRSRVVVAAAGNDGVTGRPFYPAALADAGLTFSSRIVAVAAHDGTGLCDWSNRGPWVTLAAPGADVTSTYVRHKHFHEGWAQWSGTSFATPYVVAAVADLVGPETTPAQALATVLGTAAGHSYDGVRGLP